MMRASHDQQQRWLAVALAIVLGFPLSLAVAGEATLAGAMVEIMVPRAVIYPGDRIGPGALEKRSVALSGISRDAVVLRPDEIENRIARRTLIPGQPIQKDWVREPFAVKQGEPVSVRYLSGAISIVLSAIAIESGAVGDRVAARNSETGRIVRGTVSGVGTLSVSAP
ncbi:MAG: flagellar basal body P-ring formation chaperone FlgA [Hyphomicrobium sp.]|nr:flagellar basal body P-ring formation chaperone FlgA [Hyphomicrobium sp.]